MKKKIESIDDTVLVDYSIILKDTMGRLNLNRLSLSIYYGVPVTSITKWIDGSRKPSASMIKLINVMGMVEVMSPDIHEMLLNNR